MTDCKVTISRENHEEERGSDLIDGGGGEVDLAHDGTKRPLTEEHGGDKEGNSHKETFVCHREMEDVRVRHCVHLRETEDYVDYQRVTHQTQQADQTVEYLEKGKNEKV